MRAGRAGESFGRGPWVRPRPVRLTTVTVLTVSAAAGIAGVAGIALGDDADPRAYTAARRLTPSIRVVDLTSPATDCSDDVVIVLGNSTDYAAGLTPDSIQLGWPSVLTDKLNALGTLGTVTVDNQAKPGATMAVPNPWGAEARWRWVTDIPVILGRYGDVPRGRLVFVLAPSLIDLQVTGGDVMKTVAAFNQALDVLRNAGIRDVVVLPMNPISERSLAVLALPDINARIAQFNAALAAGGMLRAYPVSPLVGAEPPAGDPVFYDDFLLPDPDGGDDRPDYLHIDADGHARIAGQLVRELPRLLSAMCTS